MNSHEYSRTGIAALDRLGANYDIALAAVAEREAQAPARLLRLPARPRWRVSTVFAAAAVCVAAVVVLSYSLLTGNESLLTTDAAIAQVAQVAKIQTLPPDDAYVFTRARTLETQFGGTATTAPSAYFVTSERQSWLSVARKGLIEVNRLSVRAPAGQPPNLGRTLTRIPYPALGAYEIGQGRYTRAQLDGFPRDPKQIYAKLSSEIPGNQADARTFLLWEAVTKPLTSAVAPLPPALRSGLIGALGMVPGVKTDGQVTDPRGNEGIGFTLDTQGLDLQIIFDKQDSAVLFEQEKVATPTPGRTLPVGTTTARYQLLDQQVVNQIPPR
ncbi:MAG: hypothetical protein ACRDKI_08710 [Solirubrobacterales bacterium]